MVPKMDRNSVNYAFTHPLLCPMMIDNEHEMLNMFVKLKPPMFQGSKRKDDFEFILD